MAKSFKYKDDNYLDSTGIVHNKILLSEILNRDFIKVTLSSQPTMTAGEYTKVPFDTLWEEINENNTFSFNKNGEITITNEYVKKVHITASVLDASWGENSIYLEIRKNGSGIKNTYIKQQSNVKNEVDIVVTKGDVLSVYFYCSSAIKISNNRAYSQMVISV